MKISKVDEMKKRIVIIIPTAKRSNLINRTLKSLSQCIKPEAFDKTIIVENGQKTDVEQVVSKYKKNLSIHYLYVERPNKANAMNEAVKLARDSFIYFSDDDVRYSKKVLMAYADAFAKRKGKEFYGGPVKVDYATEPPPKWMLEFLPPSAKGFEVIDGSNELRRGRLALGFNWAVFSEDILSAGGFNPNFGPGSPYVPLGDESDLQARLLDAGYRGVYVPEGLVWHYVPTERCNKRWLLKRAYNWGKEHGFNSKESLSYLYRRSLIKVIRGLIHLSSDEDIKYFRSSYNFLIECGRIKGKWLSQRLG